MSSFTYFVTMTLYKNHYVIVAVTHIIWAICNESWIMSHIQSVIFESSHVNYECKMPLKYE